MAVSQLLNDIQPSPQIHSPSQPLQPGMLAVYFQGCGASCKRDISACLHRLISKICKSVKKCIDQLISRWIDFGPLWLTCGCPRTSVNAENTNRRSSVVFW